jgi:para-aminobenzoate synthetase/4-amino-4-deoxychorismate lyase
MQIIAALETTPRRIYTGSIGFMGPGRRAQFNVAIRTVLINKVEGQAEYGIGGGIVWDSINKMEFEECQTKARVVTQRMPDFSIFETILWIPEDGYYLLLFHLARLKASAAYFSFNVDMEAVCDELDFLAGTFAPAAYKVRLLVAKDGGITCESEALQDTATEYPQRVCLARTPVDFSNPFLYHKTTNRHLYDRALAECPGYDDVILWNERGEVTESCIANIVVELDKDLCTPPVQCGLLAGTYRAYLLEEGKVSEKVIKIKDLIVSPHIYLVNSVRKQREIFLDLPEVKGGGETDL